MRIINTDHSSVSCFKEGQWRWLAVATYRETGIKAVILRKSELVGEDRLELITEFVVSTADNDEHLKRIMRYSLSMIPNDHENN